MCCLLELVLAVIIGRDNERNKSQPHLGKESGNTQTHSLHSAPSHF